MKKNIIFFVLLFVFIIMGSDFQVSKASNPTSSTYTVFFHATFDQTNLVVDSTGSSVAYGAKVSLDGKFGENTSGYTFAFWIVNGIVRNDLPENHQFIITGNTTIDAIYSKNAVGDDPALHAVVFMDSNGKVIETKYTTTLNSTSVTEPDKVYTSYSKPNFNPESGAARWNGTLTGITASTVRVLQYAINIASEHTVSVTGGTLNTTPNGQGDKFIYNTIVSASANTPIEGQKFSHWEINGQLASYASNFSFTVLANTSVSAAFVDDTVIITEVPIVIIRDVFLRTGSKSYVGQFYLPSGYQLIDFGVLRSIDANNITLAFTEAQRVQANKFVGTTKEFLMTLTSDIKAVSTYIVVEKLGTLEVIISDDIVYVQVGAGTLEDPIQVGNFTQLNSIRDNLTAFYQLTGNLDAATPGFGALASSDANGGLGWQPIGSDLANRFTGSFDGMGYSIDGLVINRPNTDNVGFFGHVGVSDVAGATTIKNICLTNVTIIGNRGTGALIGRVTGNVQTLIENTCVVDGVVKGSAATGGLIGSLNSFAETGAADRNPVLSKSFAKVDVFGENRDAGRDYEKIGGLVGCSQKGTISNSYSLSTVSVADSARAAERVGGLVGCNILRGSLINSYSAASVTATNSTAVGGLIGRVDSSGGHTPITNGYWNTTLFTTGIGEGTASATGLTTAQMQGSSASTNMSGLDFTNVWQTSTYYPILRGATWFVSIQEAAQGI